MKESGDEKIIATPADRRSSSRVRANEGEAEPSGRTDTQDADSNTNISLSEDRWQLIDAVVDQVMIGRGPSRCRMVTRSAEETFELGRRFGQRLESGAVFLLSGDLGAGKTVFTKGIAAGLGIDPADITSPTFTLVNVHRGRLPLYHVDLYRLEQANTENLGLDEVLDNANNVVVIEWPEKLGFSLPAAWSVVIEYVSESERNVSVCRR